MTYTEAKQAALETTDRPWRYFREAARVLNSQRAPTPEDIADAANLVRRAISLQCAR